MNSSTRLLSLILLAGLATAANGAQSDAQGLIGVWQVEEITLNGPERSGTNPDPQPGYFIFTRNYYSIGWIPRPAAREAFATPWKPTDEEIKGAYSTILFNSGTYELDESRLTTRPLISKVPDLSGGHAIYDCRIEGDTLWLTMVDEYAANGRQAPWVGNVSFPLKLRRIE